MKVAKEVKFVCGLCKKEYDFGNLDYTIDMSLIKLKEDEHQHVIHRSICKKCFDNILNYVSDNLEV